ncbi:MAG: MarR family transcriptional regulator [Solirubrobacteraceae bacterium]|jgi:DNA-binding transcriptional ArsR family regulator
MLDQIRRDIQMRLDQLLSEADKLRRALAILGSRDGAKASAGEQAPARDTDSNSAARATPTRTRGPAAEGAQRQASARSTRSAAGANATASARGATSTPGRTPPGTTKNAVLEALANGGEAMTAGQVATATGLGRASVSTTLSKLARTGEVTKAARGYQLAGDGAPAVGVGEVADDEQPPVE